MRAYIVVRNDKSSTKVAAGFRDVMQAESRCAELREERKRLVAWHPEVIAKENAAAGHGYNFAQWSDDGRELFVIHSDGGLLQTQRIVARLESKMHVLDRAHARKPIKDLTEVSWRVEECEIEDARD